MPLFSESPRPAESRMPTEETVVHREFKPYSELTPVEEAIARCTAYAAGQDYCWFRMSFAKIGDVKPSWVVWFEHAGHRAPIDHTEGSATLLEALQKLIAAVGI